MYIYQTIFHIDTMGPLYRVNPSNKGQSGPLNEDTLIIRTLLPYLVCVLFNTSLFRGHLLYLLLSQLYFFLQNKRDSTWPNATWSLDSPFNSSLDRGEATSQHVVGFPSRDQHHSVPSDRQPGGPQSSFLENTYDLFRDKSIWGIGTETPSANILPWAQLKSTELPPTDPK